MGKYAIYIVSALIFSMLTYSNALRNAIFTSNSRTTESHSINQAQNIAHSALMVAMNDLFNDDTSPFNVSEDESYNYPTASGFQTWEEMYGAYNIYVENRGDSLLVMRSTGRFEEMMYQTEVGLVKSTGGGFQWPFVDVAVHADETITLRGGAEIDGNASINGTDRNAVTFKGGVAINGILSIGPGGDPDEVTNIPNWHEGPTGGISVLSEEKEHPMPEFPAVPEGLAMGNSFQSKKWNDPNTLNLNQYDGKFLPELSVGANRSINIEVGDQDRTLVVGDLDIGNGHVNIQGTGKLDIYVTEDITLGAGSSINCNAQWSVSESTCTGETSQVMTYYGGSSEVRFAGGTFFNSNLFVKNADVTLRGGNGFRGNLISGGSSIDVAGGATAVSAFYAPNADVMFRGGGNLSGYVVSKTYEGRGGTWVFEDNLDADLPDLDGSGGGEATFTMSYWN